MGKEMLDVLAEDGTLTGVSKERTLVHRDGDFHRTCHVWITRESTNGPELLLQKRSANKDSYPGCYDISSAGHVPAGVDFIPSAIRELKEELGITAAERDLHPLFTLRQNSKNVFHGEPFINNEYTLVCLLQMPISISELTLQKEEVESVRWMRLDEVLQLVQEHSPLTCLHEEEIAGIQAYLKNEK